MRILHVTECYAGGVSRAINSIVDNFTAEHYLLHSGEELPADGFASTTSLPSSTVGRIASFLRTVRRVKPNLIHAHSSWAGLYTRLLPINIPVVYEPHCFVFDDPERSRVLKTFYRSAETLLSFNSKVTIALTTHEAKLATKLRQGQKVMFLSNVSTITSTDLAVATDNDVNERAKRPFTISMMGRVAPQKDPEFFAEVAKLASAAGKEWKFRWIGSSDNRQAEDMLTSQGIKVTGWLDKIELISALRNSHVYLHSASYEGFPLSVLDAAVLDLPIVVRDLACFDGFDLQSIGSPQAAFELLSTLEESPSKRSELRDKSRSLTERMSVENQRTELGLIYGEAIS